MSPPKRPMPARPSAVGRPPSFAPGPRKPMAPMAPLAPMVPRMAQAPLPNLAPYDTASLDDGPTVTSFDPLEEANTSPNTDELEAHVFDDPTELMEELADDEPTRLPPSDYPSGRSVPPPRPAAGSRSVPPAPRASVAPPAPPAPARPVFPSPRTSVPPAARPSFPPAPRISVPPARPSFQPPPDHSNPFLAATGPMQAIRPSQAPGASQGRSPSQAPPLFDDVNTAFVGSANMAPDFGALEARASRPEWSKQMGEAALPPQRARAHSIDLGEGVIIETLAGFEPDRLNTTSEVSDAWRPEGLPKSDLLDKPAVMRLESVRPPSVHPAGYSGFPPPARTPHLSNPGFSGSIRPLAPSIDLHAEAARAGQGRVRVAYVVAGIAIVLLLVAILSAVLTVL